MGKELLNGEAYLAALAGLLHDIGKFAQRAGERGSRIWDNTTAGRETQREYGYFHALLSADFANRYVPEPWRSAVVNGVGYHHRPQDDISHIVRLADWLSASEREQDEDSKVPYLLSVFARLGGHNTETYLPLKPLQVTEETIFARTKEITGWQDSHQNEYEDLWRDFTQGCAAISREQVPVVYLESLYDQMRRFTWCIPSAYYKNVPDVSLYDHARTTAALAACLAADGRSGAWCCKVVDALMDEKNGDAAEHSISLLVGGDISGVQRFIYSIASENAAKSLRARSFYLQLLTDAVAHFVLEQLGLPVTNLLYAGGGSFYLLTPTTWEGEPMGMRLQALQADITQRLFGAHEGHLRLALAWTPVAACEFQRGHFAGTGHHPWDRLHEQLRRAKERALAELSADEMAKRIGQGEGQGGNTQTCPVCGREQDDLEEGQPCSLCSSLEELGRQLAHATHLVIAYRPAPGTPRQQIARWWHGLEQFGVNVWAVNARKKSECYLPGGHSEGSKADIIRIYQLTQDQVQRPSQKPPDGLCREASERGRVVTAFRPFAQLVPYTWPQNEEQERIATFDDLAEHSRGIKRWGVLRMDVDNLGALFRNGFKRWENGQEINGLTLSRLASLSFSLSLFFEGYVATLGRPYQEYTTFPDPKHQAEKQGKYDKLYLQYAGGDDLFVVGAWDALPEFAADVQASFAEYVCHNPNVTISGGITLHPPKFPLYQAADQAGQAEHAAKSFRRHAGGREVTKNAISFLGQTLSWDDLAEARQRQETILRWMEQGAPRAIIQHMRTLHQEWLNGQRKAKKDGLLKDNQFYYGPWVWHAVYQLSRTARSSRNKAIGAEIRAWEDELLREGNKLIRVLGLAARWADYITRTRRKGG